jgi:predicted nucleic acid-binding protein
MILVDASVWIAFFRGEARPEADRLGELLDSGRLVVGDLTLAEVLQGYSRKADFETAKALMLRFPFVDVAGRAVALASARNYIALRERGITVRKTIDCLIATRCILDDLQLLHADRDFDPFEAHLGLRVVR